MRRLLSTTTALLALGTLAGQSILPAYAAEVPTVAIKPGTIARGPDIAVPHVEGSTIVDGTIRVTLKAPRVLLYGKWHDRYIAATTNKQGADVKLVRVSATGVVQVLRTDIDPYDAQLDAEADQIAYSFGDQTSKPTIAVYDLAIGKETVVNGFSSIPDLLDFEAGIVVVSLSAPDKTISWNTVTDDVTRIVSKRSNYASVAHDLLGFFNKDPFNGGCQVLAGLDDPTAVRWTNCDERIETVSPDGKRVATIPLLSDGPGTADVLVRRIGGSAVAHYTINGIFGALSWETNTKLLLPANGKNLSATVRCKATTCNRATDLVPTPPL